MYICMYVCMSNCSPPFFFPPYLPSRLFHIFYPFFCFPSLPDPFLLPSLPSFFLSPSFLFSFPSPPIFSTLNYIFIVNFLLVPLNTSIWQKRSIRESVWLSEEGILLPYPLSQSRLSGSSKEKFIHAVHIIKHWKCGDNWKVGVEMWQLIKWVPRAWQTFNQ